jgi:hypothetical protein
VDRIQQPHVRIVLAAVREGAASVPQQSGTPSPERSAISRTIRAASAAVSVERVGTDLPGEMVHVDLHLVEARRPA